MTTHATNPNKNRLWSTGGAGFSSKTENWATPAHVFAALDQEFGFTLDACASSSNAKCARFFNVSQDGLKQKWAPDVVWLNPPYGRTIGNWMKKAADEAARGATVVCLVPARTDTVWWHEQVMERANEVRLIRGRIRFGDSQASAPFPSALVIYRAGRRRNLKLSVWAAPPEPRRRTAAALTRSTAGSSRRMATAPARRSADAPAAPRRATSRPKRDSSALAIATPRSQNVKLGDAATTYAAQTSCPTSCAFFNGGGCYAETGRVGMVTARLNRAAAAQPSGPYAVAQAEAEAIDALNVVEGRPLRLHTVGDCATDEAARIVSAAAGRYRARGGGPVWTYTHAWRDVSRESWGSVSVLASCETAADVEAAKERGYATSIVVDRFESRKRHTLGPAAGAAAGADILPCVEQSSGATCSSCRLCFDDEERRRTDYSIAFLVHGAPATVRQATKALRTPDDPDRRLTTRELIPRAIAELEAAGERVTNAAIAVRLECSPSSVAEMRKRMAHEREAQSAMNGDKRASVAACPESGGLLPVSRRRA